MKIHNLVEDNVLEMVAEVFREEETKKNKGFCVCPQCRLDVACFVLNKAKPRYVISGRGLAHMQVDYQEKLQLDADLASLIRKGVENVNKAQRPHFSHSQAEAETVPEGSYYNLPQITGRLFNSVTFEPLSAVKVHLRENGQAVAMVDSNWQNPYQIVPATAGLFSFWPLPREAAQSGGEQRFEFEISIDESDYQPLRHFFALSVRAKEGFLNMEGVMRIFSAGDLYLNPKL